MGRETRVTAHLHDRDRFLRVVVAVQLEVRVLVGCEKREESAAITATNLDDTLRPSLCDTTQATSATGQCGGRVAA